jgi:hypothetical protein
VALDPESIWLEKGEDYPAPRAEVERLLAKWQIEESRQLWDRATRIKTPWYLGRETGLRTWGARTARTRIKVHWREVYTLKDFRQFRLAESWQRDPGPIDDDRSVDIAAHLIAIDRKEFLRWTGNVQRRGAPSLDPIQGLYCCLFDRAEIPLEYWTFPAAAAYLRFRTGHRDALDERREADRLRQWANRFGLRTARPPIVRKFTVVGGIKGFDLQAARTHGLPLPLAASAVA